MNWLQEQLFDELPGRHMSQLAISEYSEATATESQPLVVTTLGRVFGVPFSLYPIDDSSSCDGRIHDAVDAAIRKAESDAPRADERDIDVRRCDFEGGTAYFLSEQQVVLSVPITLDESVGHLAVASVPFADPKLLSSCVATAFELAGAQSNQVDLSNHLVAYAGELSETYEELVWMRELSIQIENCSVDRSLRDVAAAVLPELSDLIRAEAVGLLRMPGGDNDAGRSAIQSWYGTPLLTETECQHVIAECIKTASDEPVVVNSHSGGVLNVPQITSLIFVDLCRDDELFGWLVALNRNIDTAALPDSRARFIGSDEFGTSEAGLVKTAAALLTTHGRNVRLFQENEGLLLGVVKSLVRSLEARDSYTCGHSDRVAEISRLLAVRMGLPSLDCEHIYRAGLLHDIGKVGVPDAVLCKTGRLTDEEFEIIKKHPVDGYNILKHLKSFEFALPSVRWHHERMDGRGYPDGLKGDEIPLLPRIMAVADGLDAMTSNRPYRDGMAFEKAESILRENSGTQWDSDVVNAYFEIHKSIHDFCNNHRPSSVMSSLRSVKNVDST